MASNSGIVLAPTATKIPAAARGRVLVCASHAGAYAGYLGARAGVRAVVLNDAGVGLDEAGVSRLPVLDRQHIAAATVAAASARIGDGRSTYESGILSRANATAADLGIVPGMPAREAVERVMLATI